MNRRILIGPGTPSVLLSAVVIIISVLTLLAASAARQDEMLSDRTIVLREAEYGVMADAQAHLAQIDAILSSCKSLSDNDAAYISRVADALPEDVQLSGRTISWVQVRDLGRELSCAIEVLPFDSEQRYKWLTHCLVSLDTVE